MSKEISHWKAESMLLLMTVIWGATFLFTKIGLESSPPFLYIVLRFITALTLLLAFYWKFFRKIDKKTLQHGMVLGLLFGGGFALQTYGLEYTEITNSAFITGLTVVITPFAYRIISKHKVKLWPKIGVIIAFIGLVIFTNPELNNINLGDVLTLLSTAFWALYITYMDIFTKNERSKEKTIQLVGLQFAFALLVSLIGFFAIEIKDFYFEWNIELVTSILFNGILASFILTFIHTTYQRYSSPVKAALIFSLEPVFASIFAALFVNEILNGREYFGAALLMTGVIVSELGGYLWRRYERRRDMLR